MKGTRRSIALQSCREKVEDALHDFARSAFGVQGVLAPLSL